MKLCYALEFRYLSLLFQLIGNVIGLIVDIAVEYVNINGPVIPGIRRGWQTRRHKRWRLVVG